MKQWMNIYTTCFVVSGLGLLSGPGLARGDVVNLNPMKDNTLYESATGLESNGAGSYLFAGRTDQNSNYLRRAVMAFDVAGSVPAGSVIESVTLTLEMSRSKVNAMSFDLHKLLADWGEGASNADAQEGAGAPAETGDATWIHRFYPSDNWSTPGGDFDPTLSASTLVGKNSGSYTWDSTSQMVSDVQGWLDNPSTNYGWLLKGPEDTRSAKRFNSSENGDASTWPTLMITFTSAGASTFNWIGTGSGGSFNDGANWDAGTAPSSATDIVNLINTTTTDQAATLASSVTVDSLTINGQTNTMALGVGQGLSANSNSLVIGSLGGLSVELVTGNHGTVNVSGAAELAGDLNLSTAGATPAATDTFTFLTFASRTGRFDTLSNHQIEPGRSFSVHYNDTRALAIAGEWAASGLEITGDVDVPVDVLISGAWLWNGTLVKWGDGDLTIDLTGGFSAGSSAALAIVEGTVLIEGAGQTLNLDHLDYGDLGVLSGVAELQGVYGWYGSPFIIPEPATGVFVITSLMLLSRRRAC